MMKYLDQNNKMLVFQNEQTNHSITLTLRILESDIVINVRPAMNYFYIGDDISLKLEFKVYDPNLLNYVVLPDNFQLPAYFFCSPVVMFKYRILDKAIIEQLTDKKERNPERTIKQVIESVKKWRIEQKRTGSKKVSLVEAARMVGVSKKTLDDYFGQLRLGEMYGFDFQNGLNKKFGVLRAFVKTHRPKRQKNNKNDKYPRRLRILETYMNSPSSTVESQLFPEPIRIAPITTVHKPQQAKHIQGADLTPMDRLQQDQYQNQFYKCYQIMLNQPKDPFVPYHARDYREFKHWKQQEFNDFQLVHW